MKQFKGKSEDEKNLKNLYDEILCLSEQMSAVKEKIEKEYPIVDSLSKMKEEIEELKKKTTGIEEYKSYAERISKENEELKQNDDKKTQAKWPLRLSVVVGLLFFVFSAICVWNLFFSPTCVKTNDSIPMLLAGVIVYFVMAVIVVLFAYQSRLFFNCKK